MRKRTFTNRAFPKAARPVARRFVNFFTRISSALLLWCSMPLLGFAQNLTGYWQGVSYQPTGGSTDCYPVTIYLVQNGNSLSGTSYTYIDGTPYFAEMTAIGSVNGNAVNYTETKITDKNDAPGFEWCLGYGNLTYDPATETLEGKLFGVTESGWPCEEAYLEVYRLQILGPLTFCEGDQHTLTVEGQNVQWFADPDLKNPIGTGNSITRNIQQTTTFYVTQTTQFCSTPSPAAEVRVVISDLAFVAATVTQPTCLSPGALDATAAGSIPPIEFSLNSGAFQPSGSFQNLPPGDYSLRIRDGNGCERAQTFSLAAPQNFSVSIAPVPADCGQTNGSATANVNGTGNFEFEWSNGTRAQLIENVAAGTYTVTVSEANGSGCTASATIEILNASSAPVISLNASPTACGAANGEIKTDIFGGTQPYLFKWSTGGATKDLFNMSPGSYGLTVTDADGCSDTAFVEVGESVLLDAWFPADSVLIAIGEQTLLAFQTNVADSLIAQTEWSPAVGLSCANCPKPFASPSQPTTYILTLTDTRGCTASASVTVALAEPERLNLFIPNAFSPDDDGVNDRFEVFLGEGLTFQKMQVFDRWGNMVFESQNPADSWDGKHGSRVRAAEVFVYVFSYIENWRKLERKISGNVTVMR